jgi:DNA excision repair protein ERCC-2
MPEVNAKPTLSVSVRDLVVFVLRSGNLGDGGGGFASPKRALEGTRGHQRLQKSRPAGYQSEVPVSWKLETAQFHFELRGRIDGLHPREESLLIEEIKTVLRPWTGPADPLHLAQAKIYGALYTEKHHLPHCEILITYLELESDRTVEFREFFTAAALHDFFDGVVREYLRWLEELLRWRSLRDHSIQPLPFPFKEYRAGQRALAVAVYRAARSRSRLFASAPTGTGKTVSVLYPALKAMAEGHVERVFYLTAKTVGRAAAEKNIGDLRSAGLRLRSITLTAREKICFNDGAPCEPAACPFAIGYYDRVKSALRDGLKAESFTRDEIEALARKHQVCPFELSLDLALWCDLVICDYNYVFDPSVSLARFFSDERHDYMILIDEAHNLVDRARAMFSAELDLIKIRETRTLLAARLPACGKILGRLASAFSRFRNDPDWLQREGTLLRPLPPENIKKLLKKFLEEAELCLAQNEAAELNEPLLDLYFDSLSFSRTLDLYGPNYITLYELSPGRLRLCCLDPAPHLEAALDRTGSSVFFSATLQPLDYYRQSLGGEAADPALQLPSPFPGENLCLLVHDKIQTRLLARDSSYDAIAASLEAFISGKKGNYLIYFSSYDYLRQALSRFQALQPQSRVISQTAGMTETDREQFLAAFQTENAETLVAFAVLGGLFGEAIDLVGERLIGVVIVGVGLPQINLERDLVREYWQSRGFSGFDYAYTFPGMNRVLQAVGRVIRSESDRGMVLLIDNRFAHTQYRGLFPSWWNPRKVNSLEHIRQIAAEFWSGAAPGIPLEGHSKPG